MSEYVAPPSVRQMFSPHVGLDNLHYADDNRRSLFSAPPSVKGPTVADELATLERQRKAGPQGPLEIELARLRRALDRVERQADRLPRHEHFDVANKMDELCRVVDSFVAFVNAVLEDDNVREDSPALQRIPM